MPPPQLTPARRRRRDLAPTVALTAASAMLALSLLLPYWEMSVTTPAHPSGLHLVSYLGRIEGPLETVLATTGRPTEAGLRELSQLERSLAIATATVICFLLVAATWVHNRWAALLSLPALAFPAIVVADTTRWLQPIVGGLSAAEGVTSPPAAGLLYRNLAWDGTVLETRPGSGLFLAAAAAMVVVAGLWLHRRAYKPPLDAASADARARETRRVLARLHL